jgi:hypothetical protein
MPIGINLEKAKDIAHDIRKSARSKEFTPLDVKATIPSEAAVAEAQRQEIRVKYANMQDTINASSNIEDIKLAISNLIS